MSEHRWAASVVLAAIIGGSFIVCSLILTRAVVRVKSGGEAIRVTGSARRQIQSDFIIWRGRITSSAPKMDEAYRSLKAGMDKTKQYLTSKGVPKDDVRDGAIQTRTLYAPRPRAEQAYPETDVYRTPVGWELTQEVEVRSQKVDLVDGLSRQVTELISMGIVFASEPPEYIYTQLGELKVSMLAEAAKDARDRAEQIAKNSHCRLGPLRSARMSPLRITPAYAVVEVDAFGTNDTTTLDKEIVAVVNVSYAIR